MKDIILLTAHKLITLLFFAENTASSKTVSAVSLDPDEADANVLTDGDFSTCIMTDAETNPW